MTPTRSDPPRVALGLEPREVLLPGDEVVDLLQLDVPVPRELAAQLLRGLLGRRRPDLRRDGDAVASSLERRAEGGLRAAVHRRGVEEPHAGGERRVDDLPRERHVVLERPPRAEADDRPEPPGFHPG